MNALDPGSGGEWYTTYTHIPFYTSSKQNAFFLESQEYVVFNLEASTVTAINLMATNFTFRLFGGKKPRYSILPSLCFEFYSWVYSLQAN